PAGPVVGQAAPQLDDLLVADVHGDRGAGLQAAREVVLEHLAHPGELRRARPLHLGGPLRNRLPALSRRSHLRHSLLRPHCGRLRACRPPAPGTARPGPGARCETPHAPALAGRGHDARTDRRTAMPEPPHNWGRWGDGDQLGTLNLLTPERVLAALGAA